MCSGRTGVDRSDDINGESAVAVMEKIDEGGVDVVPRARSGEVVEGEERDGAPGQHMTEDGGRWTRLRRGHGDDGVRRA